MTDKDQSKQKRNSEKNRDKQWEAEENVLKKLFTTSEKGEISEVILQAKENL